MRIQTVSDFRAAMRSGPYAWPGAYPVFFVMGDGESLSFAAAKTERRQILQALAHGGPRDDWRPVALEINWEDSDLVCAHTGAKIESAYGDCET